MSADIFHYSPQRRGGRSSLVAGDGKNAIVLTSRGLLARKAVG